MPNIYTFCLCLCCDQTFSDQDHLSLDQQPANLLLHLQLPTRPRFIKLGDEHQTQEHLPKSSTRPQHIIVQVDYEEEYQAWKPPKDYGSYDYKPWTPSTTTWSPDWAAHPEVSPLSGDFKVLPSDDFYRKHLAWHFNENIIRLCATSPTGLGTDLALESIVQRTSTQHFALTSSTALQSLIPTNSL